MATTRGGRCRTIGGLYVAARRNQVAVAALTDRYSTRLDSARLLVGDIAIVGTGNIRATDHLRRAASAAAAARKNEEDAGSEASRQ